MRRRAEAGNRKRSTGTRRKSAPRKPRRRPAPAPRADRRAGEAVVILAVGSLVLPALAVAPLIIGPLAWCTCVASLVLGGMRGEVSAPPLRRNG
ncbi:MAG: hypothetical protein SF182_01555 [Deltaproteobacteria bacterium]|nr:hypothetical protein [Deltaproteobacteria bacterium]